ncbi:MAG: DegV family EDD domain-containing protein [Chloroflexi bacterium]|nr:DegV family EDD domain-containing protein [Chloroflexota bacterium]
MSRKVAIITDSTAYFEPGEAEKLGVHVTSLTIQLGSDRFLEGVNIDSDELFRRLNYGAPYPASLPPGAAVFEELYTKLHKQTDQMLSIHISSHLSKTLQQARLGAESLLGRCTIELVDSMTTSVGLGILVKAAAKAANDGASLERPRPFWVRC